MTLDEIRDGVKFRDAIAVIGSGPIRQRLPCRLDRQIHQLDRTLGTGSDNGFIERVQHIEGAGGGRRPAANG